MTLYRIATDAEYDDTYPNRPPDDWITLHDDYGNTDTYMVPVEPVEQSIVCDGCGGSGRQVRENTYDRCRLCDGAGSRLARVVVVEDTK